MKKLNAFIVLTLIICLLFSACGKKEEPVFIPVDTAGVIQIVRTSDGSIAYQDESAYTIAFAYNTVTEFESFDEDAEVIWEVVMMCNPSAQSAEGAEPTLYKLGYLGNEQFNVTVNGGSEGRCKITSNTLYQAFAAPISSDTEAAD